MHPNHESLLFTIGSVFEELPGTDSVEGHVGTGLFEMVAAELDTLEEDFLILCSSFFPTDEAVQDILILLLNLAGLPPDARLTILALRLKKLWIPPPLAPGKPFRKHSTMSFGLLQDLQSVSKGGEQAFLVKDGFWYLLDDCPSEGELATMKKQGGDPPMQLHVEVRVQRIVN